MVRTTGPLAHQQIKNGINSPVDEAFEIVNKGQATSGPSKQRNCLAGVSIPRLGSAAGAEQKRKSCWGMVPSGSGITPTNNSASRVCL